MRRVGTYVRPGEKSIVVVLFGFKSNFRSNSMLKGVENQSADLKRPSLRLELITALLINNLKSKGPITLRNSDWIRQDMAMFNSLQEVSQVVEEQF